jgi:hypothetical protein
MTRSKQGTKRKGALVCVLFAIASALWSASAAAGRPDDIARVIAGFPSGLQKFGIADEPAWRAYTREIATHWGEYDRRIANPMRQWGCKELDRVESGTVFYPFSGPDLPSVHALFPDADRYVLVSIQKAEAPPPLDSLSVSDLNTYLSAVHKAWRFFGASGYFRSDDLDAVENVQGFGMGVTGPLMAFAVRLGFEIDSVTPIQLGPNDKDVVSRNPSEPDAWDSVRLALRKGARKVVVDYVQVDLSNGWLRQVESARDWIDRMAEHPTLVKAASHHLQEPDFSMLRDSLLENAPLIVQDETGIEYRALTESFNVHLYGRFTRPNKLFSQNFQRSLAAAYQKGSSVKPLPFRLGYEKNTGSAVQVAVRNTDTPRQSRSCGGANLAQTGDAPQRAGTSSVKSPIKPRRGG